VAAVLLWVRFATGIRVVAADRATEASPLRLRALDGRTVELADLRGQVVLVNLWASWCGPCVTEIPGLTRVSRELSDRGLVVLGVNVESFAPKELAQVARDLGVGYDVLVRDGKLAGTFEWDGTLPTTWLIDREGRVRAAHAGLATERSFRRACERLVDE
jgi:thiol-disulfide isomerase/thioredoxin